MSYEFDGVSADRLQTADNFAILGAITVAAWIKVDATDPTVKAVMSCHDWNNFNHHFAIYASNLRFSFYNSGLRRYQSDSLAVAAGAWHHVAVTYTDGGTPQCYVNASPVSGSWTHTTGANALDAGAQPLCIGGCPRDAYYFDGQMLEAAEWSRALTATEIGMLHAGGLTRRMPLVVRPADLECYYPMDDYAEGAVVSGARDTSRNGLDMTAMDVGIVGRAAPVATFNAAALPVHVESEPGIGGDVAFNRIKPYAENAPSVAIADRPVKATLSTPVYAAWRNN